MLVDAAQLTENSRLEADVVIAGGGVAGIALARQLADTGFSVLVLESGGEKPEQRTQSLYEGTMTMGGPGNEPRPLNEYLVSSRLRCFGGSGNVWGGKCAPLDPVDFEKRDWIRSFGLAHRSRRASAFLRSRMRVAGTAEFRRAACECRGSGRTAARRSCELAGNSTTLLHALHRRGPR